MNVIDQINTRTSERLKTVIIHISIWVALFTIMFSYGEMMGRDFNYYVIIPNIIYIALFYLNYSVLIEKLLFRRKIIEYVLSNILIFTIVYFVMAELGDIMENIRVLDSPRPPKIGRHIGGHVMFAILVIAPSLSIRMTTKWLDDQKKVQESEKMRAEMELASLKNQLNPHFLFNALNNIYALISFNPAVAQSSLLNVCDLLRYQLYDSDYAEVKLEKEVQFIKDYSNLMKLRLSDQVKVEINLPEDTKGLNVAPLLFISLVENAFKHGVDAEKNSFITVDMCIIDDIIHLVCKNSNHPKTMEDRSGSGIGLVNLQRRLELIYPNSHTYNVEKNNEEYKVSLTINTQKK